MMVSVGSFYSSGRSQPPFKKKENMLSGETNYTPNY
jgi:hypothetical protein